LDTETLRLADWGSVMESVELVGGGLAEWPSGTGPRGETIAPAAYIDVSESPHLLELPHHFHAAGIAAWQASAVWEQEPFALAVTVSAPVQAAFRIPLDAARHAALISAVLREGGVYLCPTTPKHGVNARLARDHSVWVAVDRSFAATWNAARG
jgi:hypothetical protein